MNALIVPDGWSHIHAWKRPGYHDNALKWVIFITIRPSSSVNFSFNRLLLKNH